MDEASQYEQTRDEARELYHSTKPVMSSALHEHVYFPAEGFNHIIFKNARAERERTSQVARFKLLPRAIKLIGLSTTHQEYEEVRKEFEVKAYKRKIRKMKTVRYWGIIAIIDERKIKVILRRIGDNGRLHFWSIVPAWVTNKYRDVRFATTMKGDPEED